MAKIYQVLPHWFKRIDENGYTISEWCKKINKDEVFCTPCNKNIICITKGFAALTQHSKSISHKGNCAIKCKSSQFLLKPPDDGDINLSSTHTTDFVPTSTDLLSTTANLPSTSTDSTITKDSPSLKKIQLFNRRDSATKAELIWVLKTVQCNMAATSADNIKEVFCAMFTSVPGDFQLGRTKLTYLITEALGPYFKKKLLCDAQKSYYTLLYDETTNNADKKELQFKIRFWSEVENQIVVKHLETVFLGHATAKDIYNEIEAVLNKASLSLNKIVMLGSDGPKVNKKVWSLVNNMLIVERGKGLLDVGTCNLHIVNTAFLKGLEEFGEVASDLIIDIYYFFKKFPSRWDDYMTMQVKNNVPEHKFIKHVSSRWLTIGPALKRLLEQWPALVEYFMIFIPQNKKNLMKTEKYKRIVKYLKYVDIKVEINFVIESSELFSSFSKLFQHSEPLVHMLSSELKLILKKISGRICKPKTNHAEEEKPNSDKTKEKPNSDKTKEKTTSDKTKNPNDSDNKNLIKIEDLKAAAKVECGDETRKSLQLLSNKDRLDALYKIQRHYMVSHNYLAEILNIDIFSYCECLQPEVILQERSLKLIEKLSQAFLFIDGLSVLNVKDEWRLLQSELKVSDYDTTERIDLFWRKMFDKRSAKGELRYPWLQKIVKAALCLSHGNADVERGFSISKRVLTEEKSSMSLKLLNDRLIIKDYISMFKNVAEIPITKELMNLAYNAHKSYDLYMKEQKRLKEIEETKKKEEEERMEQERKLKEEIKIKKQTVENLETKFKQVAKEKKETQESADKLLEEASNRLKEALKKGNITEMRIAQGMLEGAQQMRLAEREQENTQMRLNNIINKRKSNIVDCLSKRPKAM